MHYRKTRTVQIFPIKNYSCVISAQQIQQPCLLVVVLD
ncbi:phage tail fiber domain protein, partial [Escherichia coli P02997067.6]